MTKTIDEYQDWEECPKCGGRIHWGEWSYDYNREVQEQHRKCTVCGFEYHALYQFLVNFNSNYDEFEDEETTIEEEEVRYD